MRTLLLYLLVLATKPAVAFADGTKRTAPETDRVGFPENYSTTYEILRTVVREDGRKWVTVYGNPPAASITNPSQLPYPYHSVLVMETAATRTNSAGTRIKGEVLSLHVMRKEKEFGSDYGPKRSGEWEYVEYRADGSHLTPPHKSEACSECHIKAGAERDFVYQGRLATMEKAKP